MCRSYFRNGSARRWSDGTDRMILRQTQKDENKERQSMGQVFRRFVSVCMFICIAHGIALPQARQGSAITVRRGGKTVSVIPNEFEGGVRLIGSFDPPAGATHTGSGIPLVDPKGFEGVVIGRNGNYALPEALKQTMIVAEVMWQCVDRAAYRDGGLLLYREILLTRAVEVFGNRLITAERCASMAVVSGATPAEAASGTFAFHRRFNWDISRPFSEDQKTLILRVWKASFSGAKPEVMPPMQVVSGDFYHTKLATALLNGCVSGDEAAAGFLRNALQGTGVSPGPSVKLDMARTDPRAVLLHLSNDLSNALSVQYGLWDKGISAVRTYPDKSVDGEVIGYTLYLIEGPLTSYVVSYFHGERCGDQ